MALSEDERQLLAELSAREAEPEQEDEDWEFEIYDTEKNRGARIPYKQGKGWLYETFGIGSGPAAPKTEEGPVDDTPHSGPSSRGKGYFNKR